MFSSPEGKPPDEGARGAGSPKPNPEASEPFATDPDTGTGTGASELFATAPGNAAPWQRAPMPGTVPVAMWLMGLGALLTVAQTVVESTAAAHSSGLGTHAYYISAPVYITTGDLTPGEASTFLAVAGLLCSLVWLWVLRGCRYGAFGSRTMAILFFGIGALAAADKLRLPGLSTADIVFSLVVLAVGLAVVLLLSTAPARAYFTPPPVQPGGSPAAES